jgi:hypothetical protein
MLDHHAVLTEMSLYDNITNLPESFIAQVLSTYAAHDWKRRKCWAFTRTTWKGSAVVHRTAGQAAWTKRQRWTWCWWAWTHGNTGAECGIVVMWKRRTAHGRTVTCWRITPSRHT